MEFQSLLSSLHDYRVLLAVVSEQLSAQYGAAKMLHSRVRLVLDYLKSVQTGDTQSIVTFNYRTTQLYVCRRAAYQHGGAEGDSQPL